MVLDIRVRSINVNCGWTWIFSENGVSTELANYITLVFDPAATNLLQFHKDNNNAEVVALYEKLEEELDAKLEDMDTDLLGLMEKIAVKYCIL